MQTELSFQQLLSNLSIDVDIYGFVVNLFLTAFFAFIVKTLFVAYANTSSNKRYFANNFVLLGLATMIIITIVKSSLALSLGLVGALSIVRFRTPIKEPEELVYLFLVIGIGLGLGANQRMIISVALLFIVLFVVFSHRRRERAIDKGLFLTITTADDNVNLDQVTSVLDKYCSDIDLHRFSNSKGKIEMSFIIDLNNLNDFDRCNQSLKDLDNEMLVNMLDYRDLYEA